MEVSLEMEGQTYKKIKGIGSDETLRPPSKSK